MTDSIIPSGYAWILNVVFWLAVIGVLAVIGILGFLVIKFGFFIWRIFHHG